MKSLNWLWLALLALPANAAQVYDSPLNNGDGAGVRPLPDDGTATVLNVYIDGGSDASAANDSCTGDGDGDELCAWSVQIAGSGELELLSFEAEPGVVARLDNGMLRANGLNAFNPQAVPQRVGALTVASVGAGDLILERGLAVRSDLAGDTIPVTLLASTDVQLDTDGDGVPDALDNCTLIANGNQRDTNSDGFGNACDADLNNDNIINVVDLGLLRAVFFSDDADADFNGDGVVNVVDLGILRQQFFNAPGPSGTLQ